MPAPLALAWSNPVDPLPSQPGLPPVEPLPAPDLDKFRAQFQDYAGVKADEIDERRLAARYYYSRQWTDEQILASRKEPAPAPPTNGVPGLPSAPSQELPHPLAGTHIHRPQSSKSAKHPHLT